MHSHGRWGRIRAAEAAMRVPRTQQGGSTMGRLDGKVAAITGGASGIGAGTVRRFVQEGAKVLIADLDAEKGAALAAELGDAAAFQRTDVSKEEDVAAMIAETSDRFAALTCCSTMLDLAVRSAPSSRPRWRTTT